MPQTNKQSDHCFRRRVKIRHGLHVRKFQYGYPLAIKRAKNLEIMRGNWKILVLILTLAVKIW